MLVKDQRPDGLLSRPYLPVAVFASALLDPDLLFKVEGIAAID